MLSDIIAPRRLRDGDPQALAALVAVAGWPVLAYCERAGAGERAARAVVLACVTFRRRVAEAGDDPEPDLERILLDSARDAVDELRGDVPAAQDARAAADALARATPRPLSPRLATQLLHALVDAAPVAGKRDDVRRAAERSYAEAYAAAAPAPDAPGEEDLGPASPLLLRAARARAQAPELDAEAPSPARPQAQPEPGREAQPSRRREAARAPIARLRALPPLQRAGAFAAALVLLWLVVAVLPDADDDGAAPRTVTVARTATVTAPATATATATTPAPPSRPRVVRATPGRPFSASGARFEVVLTAGASWARRIRAAAPRRGTRWVTLAVRTRNVRRRVLVPRALGYRLRSATGAVIGPSVIDVAEGSPAARAGRLSRGAQTSVQLGFEVAFEVRTLSFAFEPGGLAELTVLVALGDVR